MKKLLIILCLSGLSMVSMAESSKTIKYQGQNGESFELNTINTVTRYNEEERNSTCTRQIPYEEQECNYETDYRQECNWQPARRECTTEYDTECRTVTRHRKECTRGPSQRVCRTTKPREVCRKGVCRIKPGREICKDKPGVKTCIKVPYQDRQCTSEPREVCDRIPGGNICTTVPYQEYRCQMVTRYASEDYACRRTFKIPYSFDRRVSADVEVSFNEEDVRSPMINFIFSLGKTGKVNVKTLNKSSKPVLIAMKRQEQSDTQDDSTKTEASFSFNILDRGIEMAPVKKAIQSVSLSKNSAHFTIGKVTKRDRLRVKLVIIRDGLFSRPKTRFNKILTAKDMTLKTSGSLTKVTVNLAKFGVELKKKKHEVSIEVSLNFEDSIINLKRGAFKKKQDFEIKVK
jgi:hypothetical protein